jgi:hypothetical protein
MEDATVPKELAISIIDFPKSPFTASNILLPKVELISRVILELRVDFATGDQASKLGTGTNSYPMLI